MYYSLAAKIVLLIIVLVYAGLPFVYRRSKSKNALFYGLLLFSIAVNILLLSMLGTAHSTIVGLQKLIHLQEETTKPRNDQ